MSKTHEHGAEERPLRKVERALLHESTTQFGQAADGRAHRWWEMHLGCGHVQERGVKYTPSVQRGRPRQRNRDEAKPAPRRARCDECGIEARRAAREGA